MPEPKQTDVEASFRSSLADAIAIVEKLMPLCSNVDDLVGMMRLALGNNGQLQLLMNQVAPLSMKRLVA